MGKKCKICGAPGSGNKCDYCGTRIKKEKVANPVESEAIPTVHEVSTDMNHLDDSFTTSLSQTEMSVLTRKRNIALIGIYIAGMVLLPMLIMAVIILIRDYSLEYIQGEGFFGVLTLTNFIAYAILCTTVVLLTHKVFSQDFQKIESWGILFRQVGIGLIFTFGAAFIGNTIVMLSGTTEVALNQEMVESALATMPILMIITIVVFAPIVEEVIFRLVLMNLFNWKPIHNLIFSSLVFGLIHVISGGLIHIIPYFLMGLVFGYFYLKYKNIWHVTILHVLHNGLTAVIMFMGQSLLELY